MYNGDSGNKASVVCAY